MTDRTSEEAGAGTDPARCPLCGGPNDCVMASGEADEEAPCWCENERFPRELLRRVPAAARGRACICRVCREKSPCVAGSSSSRLRPSKK